MRGGAPLPSGLGGVKAFLRRRLPAPVREWLRRFARRARLPGGPPVLPPRAEPPRGVYEAAWEAMGRLYTDDEVVGSGDFDLIGRIELGVLLMEGLRPTHTLVDFGCGTGRLAVHVIPRLVGGHYIGLDISQAMLDKAQQRIARTIRQPPCRLSWIKQTATAFPFEDQSVDLICAFSVFTHMEHEDTYRYLKDALRVVGPGGRVVFSCLPITLRAAQDVFLKSARYDFHQRWSATRDVTTSVELMATIARLAGWTPLRWYAGDEPTIRLADTGEMHALGQAVCVLTRADEPPGPSPGYP